MINDELLQQGIDLAKNGDLHKASRVLAEIVKTNPLSEEGWLWLGYCRTVPKEKKYCLNKVLTINPNNADALRELSKLESSIVKQLQPSAQSAPSQTTNLPTHQPLSMQINPSLDSSKVEAPIPVRKNWVRRTLYLLAGIVIGFYLGAYIFNSPAVYGYLAELDRNIALKIITVPDYQGPPALVVQATPTISPDDPYEKRLEQAWSTILQADILLQSQRYSDAILLWNQALAIVPEYADGYYKRAVSYYELTGSQKVKSEYDHYLQLAINDLDTAISLNPNKGDYFLMRARAYATQANQQTQRVDYQKLSQVAVENYVQGLELPQQETWNGVTPAIYSAMVNAGDCQAVIPKIQDVLSMQAEPSPKLEGILGEAYYCIGDLENALKHINEAYRLSSLSICLCERAIILYDLNRLDEAMADIEKTLSENPYYGGDRFYIRALFYADQGNIDQAQKDLDFGMTQTWGRGGLLSYVQGKIALSQGKKQEAIYYFQDAEVTYLKEGPMLDKIRQDLLALGGTPREPLFYPFQVTPMPLLPTATLPASPTPTAMP